LRIARAATGGTGIIVTDSSYHGNSQATFEISADSISVDDRPDYVVTVPSPDTYRGAYRDDEAGARYAAYVADAVDVLRSRGFRPAAFVIDTIVSSDGIVSPPRGYLVNAARIIRDAGGLFIADEVQPGFGRTGSHFWGFEKDGVIPDIVSMGKPMGNGHPIAGIVAKCDVVNAFAQGSGYFNTFGGNPVSCAAALAVLDVIENEGLQENARQVGRHVSDHLWKLAEKHECIGDIRGTGLFIALDLVDSRGKRTPATALASRVVNDLCQRGVLTGSIGPDANILKLRPPLVLSSEDADYMIDILDASLSLASAAT